MPDLNDMNQRLGKVETVVSDIRVAVGKIETTLTHVPTKAYLLTVAVGALLTVVSALVGGYFWLFEALADRIIEQLK